MFKNILQAGLRGSSQRSASAGNLHERVRFDLTEQFGGSASYAERAPSADVVILQGPRVAVVEIKIGDPSLPLPSSTSSQMHLLAKEAKRNFSEDSVIPVLVTNYSVTPGDRKELEDEGVTIVPLAPALSGYDSQRFSREFARIVGLSPAQDSASSAASR